MSRPKKCRKVCCMPVVNMFAPSHYVYDHSREIIVMTVDEYETIRLIDREGLSQSECSKYMNVARTTVQHVYNNARRKIADALVLGMPLEINGGDYTICDRKDLPCSFCGCNSIFLK
ncbi:MAG: DUF134 domain-containing protein [Mucispirillum sp.]|nr:DUF134 domain-containing protein [Mucispirillum sp.]